MKLSCSAESQRKASVGEVAHLSQMVVDEGCDDEVIAVVIILAEVCWPLQPSSAECWLSNHS